MDERIYSEDFIVFASEGAEEAAELRRCADSLKDNARLASMLHSGLFGGESNGRLLDVAISLSDLARNKLLLADEAEAHVINDIIDNGGLEAYTAHRRTNTARQIGMIALAAMTNPRMPFPKDLLPQSKLGVAKPQITDRNPNALSQPDIHVDKDTLHIDLHTSNFTRYTNKKRK